MATAKGAATAHVVSHLTELAVVFGAIFLRAIDQLAEENLIYALLAIVGPAVAKVRGKPPSGSSILLLGWWAAIAKKITFI